MTGDTQTPFLGDNAMIDDRSIERFDPIRGVGKKPGNWRKIPGHVFHVAGAREDLLKRELASISIDGGRGGISGGITGTTREGKTTKKKKDTSIERAGWVKKSVR